MVLKGSNTNRAASHWDYALFRKVAEFLSQHCRCAHTKPCKPYLLARRSIASSANQRERPNGKRDKMKRLFLQFKSLSMSVDMLTLATRKHSSTLLISFWRWHSCSCKHLCWKTHSIGRLGNTTESRGEDDKQSTGWGKEDLQVCSVLFSIHLPWEVGQGI